MQPAEGWWRQLRKGIEGRSVVKVSRESFLTASNLGEFEEQCSKFRTGQGDFRSRLLAALLLLRRGLDDRACAESLTRLCLFVRKAIPQLLCADSACLFFQHEHPDELRSFAPLSEEPGESSHMADTQRAHMYRCDDRYSWVGRKYQKLRRQRRQGHFSFPPVEIKAEPFLWTTLPDPNRPNRFTNGVLEELLPTGGDSDTSSSTSSTSSSLSLFVLIRGSHFGSSSVGLLAIRNPRWENLPLLLSEHPSQVEEVAGHLGLADRESLALVAMAQIIVFGIETTLRAALREDAFKAELMKQDFLLGLTQYVCKDRTDIGRAMMRFDRILQASFHVAIAICFAVDDVAREMVRIWGGECFEAQALPFRHRVIRLCMESAEPVLSTIPWREFWSLDEDSDTKETDDCISTTLPPEAVEDWLDQQMSCSVEKVPPELVATLTARVRPRRGTASASLRRPRSPSEPSEGPKVFLPIRSADGRTKLLMVLVRKELLPRRHRDRINPRMHIENQRTFTSYDSAAVGKLEAASTAEGVRAPFPQMRSFMRLSSRLVNAETPWKTQGPFQEVLSSPRFILRTAPTSKPSPSSPVVDRPVAFWDWELDGTFPRQFLEVLRQASEILSLELDSAIPRYVMRSLMLSQQRRESGPSHSIIEFAFGPSEPLAPRPHQSWSGHRRASAPYALHPMPRKSPPEDRLGALVSPVRRMRDTWRRCSLLQPVREGEIPVNAQDNGRKLFRRSSGSPSDANTVPVNEAMYRAWRTQSIDWWRLPMKEGRTFFNWSLDTLGFLHAIPGYEEARSARLLLFDFISASYRKSNPYHNAAHALQVYHTLWLLLSEHQLLAHLNPVEAYSLMLAGFAHDVDHPGVTNQFLSASDDPLAIRYNDRSVLEHHHAAYVFQAVMARPEMNFLEPCDTATRRQIRKAMIEYILATDMQLHSKMLSQFTELISRVNTEIDCEPPRLHDSSTDNGCSEEWTEEDRNLIGCLLIHAADLSNPVLPFPWFTRWSSCVIEEFNAQTDRERELQMEITGYMNCRTEKARIEMQLGFSEFVVLPLWRPLMQFEPSLTDWVAQGEANSAFWRNALAIVTRQPATPPTSRADTMASYETVPEARSRASSTCFISNSEGSISDALSDREAVMAFQLQRAKTTSPQITRANPDVADLKDLSVADVFLKSWNWQEQSLFSFKRD